MNGTELLARFMKIAGSAPGYENGAHSAELVAQSLGGKEETRVLLETLMQTVPSDLFSREDAFYTSFFLGWILRGVFEGIELVPTQEKKEATT